MKAITGNTTQLPQRKSKLLEGARQNLRRHYDDIRTEKAYWQWLCRFILCTASGIREIWLRPGSPFFSITWR